MQATGDRLSKGAIHRAAGTVKDTVVRSKAKAVGKASGRLLQDATAGHGLPAAKRPINGSLKMMGHVCGLGTFLDIFASSRHGCLHDLMGWALAIQ